jgi:hypothetical protein
MKWFAWKTNTGKTFFDVRILIIGFLRMAFIKEYVISLTQERNTIIMGDCINKQERIADPIEEKNAIEKIKDQIDRECTLFESQAKIFTYEEGEDFFKLHYDNNFSIYTSPSWLFVRINNTNYFNQGSQLLLLLTQNVLSFIFTLFYMYELISICFPTVLISILSLQLDEKVPITTKGFICLIPLILEQTIFSLG